MIDGDDYGLPDGIVIDLHQDDPTAPREMPMGTAHTIVGRPAVIRTDSWSLKQLALAYGGAANGTREEADLLSALVRRVRDER